MAANSSKSNSNSSSSHICPNFIICNGKKNLVLSRKNHYTLENCPEKASYQKTSTIEKVINGS